MSDGSDDLTVQMTGAEPAPDREGDAAAGERYRVLNRIGKGGMGEVMAVRDEVIGREVALKRIRRAAPSERMIARFLREASIQGRLEHPAIVPMHDLGRDAHGLPFFTMRKLSGTTLAKMLAGDRTAVPVQRMLRAFVEVCLAVEYAHVRGVVHRDLKPDNILLGDYGEVYVLDWGVARVRGEAPDDFEDISGSDERVGTIPGTAIGTPGYIAPEQVRGLVEVDGRADVYSLGCILFEILAGSRLHPSGNVEGLASALSGIDARPSVRSGREVAPELEELCVRATAIERDQRIATARELGDRVQQFLDGDRDLVLRRRLAAEHLAAARTAFESGERADAMRDAAAALALDPSHAGAAELVGRLMLEPPPHPPREVEDAIRADDARITRTAVKIAAQVYLVLLAFIPLMWWVAPADSRYPLVLGLLALLNLALCVWGRRARIEGREWGLGLASAVLIAVVARAYTPFLIAPAIAALTTMAIAITPNASRLTRPLGMTALSLTAVLAPWLLERAGVLSTTTVVDENGLWFTAAALGGNERGVLLVAVLYVIVLVAVAGGLAHSLRAREAVARRHLHLQAWQLRQLVPATAAAPPAA